MNSIWGKTTAQLVKHLGTILDNQYSVHANTLVRFLLDLRNQGGALYLIAAGRSLNVLDCFKVRLEQSPINIEVRRLILSSQPTIQKSDAALVCSGTGVTETVVRSAKAWSEINTNIAIITSKAQNTKLRQAIPDPKVLILIPGIKPQDVTTREEKGREIPLSIDDIYDPDEPFELRPSNFEMATLLFLEGVVFELFLNIKEGAKQSTKT
jgi:D-arabinose 5-phosphate isomerase GutQ